MLLRHLLELRQRLLRVVIFFVLCCVCFFFLAPHLFHGLMRPLFQILPEHASLIATNLTSPLFISMRLAADAAMICTMPYGLLQLWSFASPGLYQHERYRLCGTIVASWVLFCLGLVFCFYVVLPFMLQFFVQSVPTGVQLMPDIAAAVDFMTRMLMVFGLCFQVPLGCVLLVMFQFLSITTLKVIRPYVIVVAFILGMLLTPPDVLSQLMVAVPLCVLYELGILGALGFAKAPDPNGTKPEPLTVL